MALNCPLRLIINHNRRLTTTIRNHPHPYSSTTSLSFSPEKNKYASSCSSCSQYSGSTFHGLSSTRRLLSVPNIVTRSYSSDSSDTSSSSAPPNRVILPPLTPNYGPLTWPKISKTWKNFQLRRNVIVPYLDPEFNLREFLIGSRDAAVLLSQKLASKDFEDLEELVDPSTLEQVKSVVSILSDTQRELLVCKPTDFIMPHAYEIRVVMPDSIPGVVKPEQMGNHRFVEITVVFYVLKLPGPEEVKKMSFSEVLNSDDIIINYKFHKDFNQNQESSWIVKDIMNYFPTSDVLPTIRLRK